ncbi:S-formylglutathione hydrolase [Catenovulum sp. SM1970]|uniref:S-formylglutathione hydrolase n=1 Tax=Marinifaba aquimaris TaxID=2741323 RepID=UPI0015739BF0|nr:S-formylglutathione hydrolase [Marinifaba aquimaris]NTS78106.1 S-formylglutathione hydrolase [Marinifaba aquimaris]
MLKKVSENRVFSGQHLQYEHSSKTVNCNMRFAIFLPDNASDDNPVPALYWLSGLTCTDENFMQKAGALKKAAELGIAIIAPDTSPRGSSVADNDSYDLGQGAGFYLNATQAPWAEHYKMFDYINEELPSLIEQHFPVSSKRAISGHSMGGHGALVIGLSNPDRYRSISAFSPICHPSICPWGEKAFSHYLGTDKQLWQQYDATELLRKHKSELSILIDQGDKDSFLAEQLYPEHLTAAAKSNDSPLTLRMQKGYDHSYYFIASFIDEHLDFHAQHLLN